MFDSERHREKRKEKREKEREKSACRFAGLLGSVPVALGSGGEREAVCKGRCVKGGV